MAQLLDAARHASPRLWDGVAIIDRAQQHGPGRGVLCRGPRGQAGHGPGRPMASRAVRASSARQQLSGPQQVTHARSCAGKPSCWDCPREPAALPKAFVRSAASWHESFMQQTRVLWSWAGIGHLGSGPHGRQHEPICLGECIFAGGTFVALPHFSPDAALEAMPGTTWHRLVLVPTVLGLIASRGLATGQSGQQLTFDRLRRLGAAGGTLALARKWAPNATSSSTTVLPNWVLSRPPRCKSRSSNGTNRRWDGFPGRANQHPE